MRMLEVSRVGVAESDDEIELSLELSIGGSYGKCEKSRKVFEESLSNDNQRVVVTRPGYSFSEASVVVDQVVEGETRAGSVPETVDPNRKREIQALRRLEARRKREEKMRKSTVNFRGINAYDKACLEAQQLQERVQDRKIREDDNFLEDKSGRKKETVNNAPSVTNEAAKGSNFALKNDETANQNHCIMQMRGLNPQSQCAALKNDFVYPYGVPSLGRGVVPKEENEMKDKCMFQQVACGNFRPYPYGNGNGDIVRQNSGTGFDSGHNSARSTRIVNQKAVSNGSLERSSSAISDYRSTSGKAGSISDTGSHSSCLQANDPQLSLTTTSDVLHLPEINCSWTKDTVRSSKNIILSKESECRGVEAVANSKPDTKVNTATSKSENATCSPPKQSSEASDNPSKNQSQNCGMPSLQQMPCVSTTGNGPNGKTITGFLYRYTKMEVSIVCVCHGSSFSPAEFVEHAGGTDITNPLRHITMVPASFG